MSSIADRLPQRIRQHRVGVADPSATIDFTVVAELDTVGAPQLMHAEPRPPATAFDQAA
jgi:hypothetical protein